MADGAQILLVDDDPDVLDVVKEWIEIQEIAKIAKIDTAPDGMTSLGLLADQKYDLVITDFLMPGLSGLKLIEKIRGENDLNRNIPVICLSGYLPKINADTPAHILENVMFLEKPFEERKFCRVLKFMLLGST